MTAQISVVCDASLNLREMLQYLESQVLSGFSEGNGISVVDQEGETLYRLLSKEGYLRELAGTSKLRGELPYKDWMVLRTLRLN